MPDCNCLKQNFPRGRWGFFCLAALLLFLPLLGACGKKPDQVDPPPGVGQDNFPRIYPDPATDPKP